MLCGFLGGPAVEGHQSGRHARNADEVSPPALRRDERHLDRVRLSCDGLFETMDDFGHERGCVLVDE